MQSMSFIYYLYKQRNIRGTIQDSERSDALGPFLIIVPLSTISHWQREFERWTEMNLILYHGNATSRELLRQFEWYFEDGKVRKEIVLIFTTRAAMTPRAPLNLTWL